MPERCDQRALFERLLRAFLVRNRDPQGRADQADDQYPSPDNDAQDDSLAKGEAAGTDGRLRGSAALRVLASGTELL